MLLRFFALVIMAPIAIAGYLLAFTLVILLAPIIVLVSMLERHPKPRKPRWQPPFA
jgi:hypothetical protein